MQDSPDAPFILGRLGRFLEDTVRPAIQDPALAYRLRVAAALLGQVERELAAEEKDLAAEAERLAVLEPLEPAGPGREAQKHAVRVATTRLARRVRAGSLSAEERALAWAHARQTLREKLAVAQPRFDLTR